MIQTYTYACQSDALSSLMDIGMEPLPFDVAERALAAVMIKNGRMVFVSCIKALLTKHCTSGMAKGIRWGTQRSAARWLAANPSFIDLDDKCSFIYIGRVADDDQYMIYMGEHLRMDSLLIRHQANLPRPS